MNGTANVVPEPSSIISIAAGISLVLLRKRLRRAC
ncbi:MAG: PEP-CTERM sorting domain-containing protein [bacterium]